MAILAPVLVLFILFIVLVGRLTTADLDATDVAATAARAAALERSPGAAVLAAQAVGTRRLGGPQCPNWTVRTDVSRFRAAGLVRVTVTCRTSLSELAGLRVPGQKTVSAVAVEHVDDFRGTR